VFIVASVYIVIDSVRKLLDTPSYTYDRLSESRSTVKLFDRSSISYNRRFYSHAVILSNVRGSRVRLPAGAGNFSLRHRVQNGPRAHQASYPMGTGDSYPGGKASGAWSWPLTSI